MLEGDVKDTNEGEVTRYKEVSKSLVSRGYILRGEVTHGEEKFTRFKAPRFTPTSFCRDAGSAHSYTSSTNG